MTASKGATRVISPIPGTEALSVRCARLHVVRGPDKGKALTFGERRSAVIGTDHDADLTLTDDSVSARHAELRAEERGYVLRDLGSTNGVRVEGVLVTEAILDGRKATISLGETDLQLATSREEVVHPLSTASHFGTVLGGQDVQSALSARVNVRYIRLRHLTALRATPTRPPFGGGLASLTDSPRAA